MHSQIVISTEIIPETFILSDIIIAIFFYRAKNYWV